MRTINKNYLRTIPLLLLTLVLGITHTYAQDIDQLNKEKEKTKKDIELTNSLLNDTQKSSTLSLNKLQVINSQVTARQKLIGQIQQELNLTQGKIETNQTLNEKLKQDIKVAEDEYGKLLYNIYFRNSKYDNLLFVLSASSMDMAYSRIRYLKELTSYQKKQADLLMKMQAELANQTKKLLNTQEKKKTLYIEKEKETEKLLTEKQKQNSYLGNLKVKEKNLKNQLNEYKKRSAQLNKQINKIIKEQAKKDAKRTETEKKVDVKLSANFAQNKGKLPWPVTNGVIISRFGKNQVSQNIVTDNEGIDIQTSTNTNATAVFGGEVTGIFGIQGSNNTIMVRHGDYITVYSNLVDVYVKKGEKVILGQKLGRIFTDTKDNNKTVIHFSLWKNTTIQNPELWLK